MRAMVTDRNGDGAPCEHLEKDVRGDVRTDVWACKCTLVHVEMPPYLGPAGKLRELAFGLMLSTVL